MNDVVVAVVVPLILIFLSLLFLLLLLICFRLGFCCGTCFRFVVTGLTGIVTRLGWVWCCCCHFWLGFLTEDGWLFRAIF